MGFKVERTHYRLRFEDPEYEGLVVTARSTSTGTVLSMQKLIGAEKDIATAAPAMRTLMQTFADSLVEWNLEEEDGSPIPMTYEGVAGLEPSFLKMLIAAWSKAVAGVMPPLPPSSPNGRPFPEASLPMAVLSPSLGS